MKSCLNSHVGWFLVSLIVTMAAPNAAPATSLVFSEPDFDWLAASTGATPYHIWTTGDHWTQNFSATGVAQANHADLHLFINDNVLVGGNQLNLNLLLNGNLAGSFSIPAGTTGALDVGFNFASVAGPDYLVRIQATNTIPDGAGSVSIAPDGRSTITLVPEPATLGLLAAMLLAASMRRGRARSV